MKYVIKGRRKHVVEIVVFRDVENAEHVLGEMKAGNLEACLLDGALIPDIFIALVATSNALRKDDDDNKVTKNLFTEIVYNLSPTRNISYALRTFGISPKTEHIIAIVPHPTEKSTASLCKTVKSRCMSAVAGEGDGKQTPEHLINQLHSGSQQGGGEYKQRVRELYDITDEEIQDGDGHVNDNLMINSIVTRMACRDIK